VVLGGALLALVAAVLFFQGLGRYPLWDPDEARHAEVAREMAAARGGARLFLPTLEFEPYQEKPAPFYWLVLLAYRLHGVDEAAARSVSALAALALVLAVYAWAVRRSGIDGALGGGLVLATCGGFYGLARFVNLDMVTTACVSAGVLAGLAWLESAPPRRRPLIPYLAAAAGTLVKGPLAGVLTLGPLLLAVATARPRPSIRELGLGRGLLVAAIPVVAFWLAVGSLDRSYVAAFAATNVRRFDAASPHAGPPYYYLLWLPVLFLPWTLLAPRAVVDGARDPARRPLVLWAAFVPIVLTFARGKLATYALSALVPLALLVGPELARVLREGPRAEEEGWLRAGAWIAVVLAAAGAVAAVVAGVRFPLPVVGSLALATVALAWSVALGRALWTGATRRVPALVLGAVVSVYVIASPAALPAIGRLHSDREAARLIAAAPSGPVVAFAARAPSLVFYLRAAVLRTEDLSFVADLFAHEEPVYLVAGYTHWDALERRLGARAHVWQSTSRRRLYANRPPPNGSP